MAKRFLSIALAVILLLTMTAVAGAAQTDTAASGEPLRGDYDGDGEITIMDATRAQRIIAELDERPDDTFLTGVDADRDGELTIMDATRIQRVIAELCDWDGNLPPAPEPDELPPVDVSY